MFLEEGFSEGFSVHVPAGTSILDGELQIPAETNGLIILAYAGNRLRVIPQIQTMAEHFSRNCFGTLIMDLLTEEEEEIERQNEGGFGFDAEMVADRLDSTLDWIRELPETCRLPVGLYGLGSGAWAAFAAAAAHPESVSALVATGVAKAGEMRMLRGVKAPTLLIAAEKDPEGLRTAQDCMVLLSGRKKLEAVLGARKLWGDEKVEAKIYRLSCLWFDEYLEKT